MLIENSYSLGLAASLLQQLASSRLLKIRVSPLSFDCSHPGSERVEPGP